VATGKSKSSPQLITSFDGLNHRDQRTANGGNQFSVEPPDQGLCAGNGFVMESLNDVLRVYDRSGNALVGVIDLNTFYGYPPAINRTTRQFGPFVTDPSCYFDADTQRWFNVVLTLDVDPVSGDFLGPNHLDLAVSTTSDPTGSYTIYRIPAQDDGTQGTPNHNCAGGPCLGDFPHLGADRNGFYITTNEYPFFEDGFHAAQLYALSKRALASGAATVSVTQIDTIGAVGGNPGFTVWPATSPAGGYADDLGGTEYLLSSMAAEEANGNGTDNRIALWALSNTSSLNSASPAINLRNTVIPVTTYSEPPKADQKPGSIPLGDCINDTTTPTPAGIGCWRLLFTAEPAHNEVESRLDASDTRMQQVVFANGRVWGALGTAVSVGGATKAGVAFYSGGSPDLREQPGRQSRQAGPVRNGRQPPDLPEPRRDRERPGCHHLHPGRRGPLPERRLCGPGRGQRRGPRPGRPRGSWAVGRVHQLQGVRRQPAEDTLGRLRRDRGRRQQHLDRLRVHRADLHPHPVADGPDRSLRQHPHLPRQLGHAHQPGQAIAVRHGAASTAWRRPRPLSRCRFRPG